MKKIMIHLKPFSKAEQAYLKKLKENLGPYIKFNNLDSQIKDFNRKDNENLESKVGPLTPEYVRDWIENN